MIDQLKAGAHNVPLQSERTGCRNNPARGILMKKYNSSVWMEKVEQGIKQGPYTDTWESLSEHETPRWFRDAKFGIFIHWGLYSVPSFNNEWYSRNMYVEGTPEYQHHLETYGKQKDFGYKDFIPLFKAEKFDADAWAELFKNSGARYVVPVAEHHDGFQMYKSNLSDCNAEGPYKRSIFAPHRALVVHESGKTSSRRRHTCLRMVRCSGRFEGMRGFLLAGRTPRFGEQR